ncbi:MAG TPA: DUF1634 domain-containing protein [Patescibacteria group bacterium]|nr:DUF1634 domain-containing protein [Patescibacteria group bacterium]
MTESGKTGATGKQRLEFDMDLLVGYILLIGVLLSLALVLAALIWKWMVTRTVEFDYTLSGMNFVQLLTSELRLAATGALRPRLLLTLGILMLMLTPFLRVFVSMVYFMFGLKNWKYTVFTAFVLVTLIYSLCLR